jgi:hypothetical protein
MEELCAASDKAAKQRLGAEIVAGLVRGCKHWHYDDLQVCLSV